MDGLTNIFRGEFFHIAHNIFKRVAGATYYHVYMVSHQAPAMYQAFLALAKFNAVNPYRFILLPYKNIYPINHRIRNKIQLIPIPKIYISGSWQLKI